MKIITAVLNKDTRNNLSNSLNSLDLTFNLMSETMFKVNGIIDENDERITSIFKNLEKSNDNITSILSNFSSLSDDLANSNILVSIENPTSCDLESLSFFVSIPNGPSVNIAFREIFSPDISKPFRLDKSHSLVRGFDITSAFLQQEIIKIEVQAKCDNYNFQAFKTLDLKHSKNNQEELFFYTNEWLKKEQ